jgi:hypothetical protein
MTTNFGFSPGILDYWMLLADWRNGSFAILLAVGVLLVGYALATRNRMPAAEGPHVPRRVGPEPSGPDGRAAGPDHRMTKIAASTSVVQPVGILDQFGAN